MKHFHNNDYAFRQVNYYYLGIIGKIGPNCCHWHKPYWANFEPQLAQAYNNVMQLICTQMLSS